MSSKPQKEQPNDLGFDGPIPNIIKSWPEKSLFEKLTWYYNQYSMSLCLSILEPWERKTFNFFFFSIILAITYTAIVYIPIHLSGLWSMVNGAFEAVTEGKSGGEL